MYCFMTGGYHDSGFTALMTVSRLPYIVILIHDLLHAHYEYAIMNYCIFTEYLRMFESWILNLVCEMLSISSRPQCVKSYSLWQIAIDGHSRSGRKLRAVTQRQIAS